MAEDRQRSAQSLVEWSQRNGRSLGSDPKTARAARDLGLLPPEPRWVDEPPPPGNRHTIAGDFVRRWQSTVDALRQRPRCWASLGTLKRHEARQLKLKFPDIEVTTRDRKGDTVQTFARAKPAR